MKNSLAWVFGLALVGSAVFASHGRCDLIPWKATGWNPDGVVYVVQGASAPLDGIEFLGGPLTDGAGPGDVQVVGLRSFYGSDPNDREMGVFQDTQYTLALDLVDTASGAAETFTFSGTINGVLTPTSTAISNMFTGESSQSRILGANRYTLSLADFNPPGQPGDPEGGELGSIWAHVEVSPAEAPEPATLLLAGSGLPLLWGFARRRRQRTQPLSGAA